MIPRKSYLLEGGVFGEFRTWLPPLMVSPNQMCLLAWALLYEFLAGMFTGWAWMQVSPVEKSQYTLMASIVHPWLGSIQ